MLTTAIHKELLLSCDQYFRVSEVSYFRAIHKGVTTALLLMRFPISECPHKGVTAALLFLTRFPVL